MDHVKCTISSCSLRREQSFSLHMCTHHEVSRMCFLPKLLFSPIQSWSDPPKMFFKVSLPKFYLTILHFRTLEKTLDMCYFLARHFLLKMHCVKRKWLLSKRSCFPYFKAGVLPVWPRSPGFTILREIHIHKVSQAFDLPTIYTPKLWQNELATEQNKPLRAIELGVRNANENFWRWFFA